MIVPCTALLYEQNSNNKIVHKSIEPFLCNPSDFFSDDVLPCRWIVFTSSCLSGTSQKIVRWVEILRIGWPGVTGLTWNESVPWEVMPRHSSVLFEKWGTTSFQTTTLNRTLEYSRHNFPRDRLNSRQIDNPWPSYSQNLNPPDYFYKGYLKDRVYKNNPVKRGHH